MTFPSLRTLLPGIPPLAAAFLALGLGGPPAVEAQTGPRVAHQPSEQRPFSAAVQVGDTYWLSGKLGVTDETRAMTEGRVAAETHNIMQSFEALLTELGLDWDDVVRGTVYLTDVDQYDEMNEAYARYFQGIDPPSRVAVAVAELVAGGLLEISFVAVRTP